MNPLNYASLEASNRLVDSGIVLESENYWRIFDSEIIFVTSWQKKSWEDQSSNGYASGEVVFIPAPSMAEVWRELPESIYILKGKYGTVVWLGDNPPTLNTNPTDALIDLLIWVSGNSKEKEPKVSILDDEDISGDNLLGG